MVPYQTYQNILLIFMWRNCLFTDWKYINIMETKKKTIQPQMYISGLHIHIFLLIEFNSDPLPPLSHCKEKQRPATLWTQH